jgi:TM2 domain-containing membrane protein YozV
VSLVPVSRKIPAGIAGIVLGAFGVHKFIMGFPRAGMTMLGITAACWLLGFLHFPFVGLIGGAVALLGFVEGIIYLVKNDHDFYRDYNINRQEWL